MKIAEIEKQIVSLTAFLPEDKDVLDIIQLCHLYPVESWKNWTDYLGWTLGIADNKKVIIHRDLPFSYDEYFITDLFYKSHPSKLFSNSSKVVIALADSNKNDTAFVWLLGKDKRLRMATFSGKWIENISPLLSGMKTLRIVLKALKEENPGPIETDYKELRGALPASIIRAWSTTLPITANVKLDMMLTNNILASKILKDLEYYETK